MEMWLPEQVHLGTENADGKKNRKGDIKSKHASRYVLNQVS